MLFFIDGASKVGDHVCCKDERGSNSFSDGILCRLFFSKAGFVRAESEAKAVFDAIFDVRGGTDACGCTGRGELDGDDNPPDCRLPAGCCVAAGISPYCCFIVGNGPDCCCNVGKPLRG